MPHYAIRARGIYSYRLTLGVCNGGAVSPPLRNESLGVDPRYCTVYVCGGSAPVPHAIRTLQITPTVNGESEKRRYRGDINGLVARLRIES